MGREMRYTEKLILSLFDYSGTWAKPWIDAGYPVMLFDKKIEGDILDFDILEDWISGFWLCSCILYRQQTQSI